MEGRGAGVLADATLAARLRAELGHHVERPREIQVAADAGRVVLRGSVPADERPEVLATVRAVRGVKDVENDLVASRRVRRRDAARPPRSGGLAPA